MNSYIKERTLLEARHILDTGDTVRKTGEFCGVSKSTVHYDMSKRLKRIDAKLYYNVKKILDKNFDEKHIRGGNSTKNKYLKSTIK